MKILIWEGTKAVSALSWMHSPWRQMTMLAPPKPEWLPLHSPHSRIPLHKCLHMCSCLQPPSQCLMVQHTTSGKHHLSFCTFSHLNNFLLRCDKIKYFMTAFSVLFLLISCRKVLKNFYVLCDKKCDK